MAAADVILEAAGDIGWITLNRPDRLNAINPYMFRRIASALRRWREDPGIRAVVLRGAGGRVFSAGGDLQILQRIDVERASDYWSGQSALVLDIAGFPKPFVALLDGIAMGAGVGVAVHGSHRVVTERAHISMPETRIGLVPDSGTTLLFARMPGAMGEFFAATGRPALAGDALAFGFADVFVSSRALPELESRLRAGEAVERALERVVSRPELSPSLQDRAWIDAAFARSDARGILADLESRPMPPAHEAARELRAGSPAAVDAALALVRGARRSDDGGDRGELARALERELRANVGLFCRRDRVEGIRARIIDKDRSPVWSPAWSEPADAGSHSAVLTADIAPEWLARLR